jgi:hypothetical protein
MRFLILAAALLGGSAARADGPAKTLFAGRLIYQNHATATLKWADVRVTAANEYSLTPPAAVPGCPALDSSKQKLVQMKAVQNKVLVGVRDDQEGKVGSGWVMLTTNVKHHDHGDHGHWTAKGPPAVLGSRIDTDQGNPAHLYEYGGKFYLANDRKNGYTRFDPAEWFQTAGGEAKEGTPRFTPGGGNHITLAVVNDAVGYSCWIDGGGPNAGKVDVTPIGAPAIKYSFTLPSGVIHGATACANKVFFAPADGICWVEADTRFALAADKVQVHHIPLGKTGDKPNRTGAFETHGNHVLCVTGREDLAKLVIVRATAAEPKPVFVPLHGKAGNKPVTPAVVSVDKKTPTAFVFHDHDRETEAEDLLEVIALDPDGDRDYADARLVKVLKVGPSAVSGHFGHHAIAFDADGRVAFITNPGDGTISVLDLVKLEIKATFKVGGTPTALIAHGGRDAED